MLLKSGYADCTTKCPSKYKKGTLKLKYHTVFSINLLKNSIYTCHTHKCTIMKLNLKNPKHVTNKRGLSQTVSLHTTRASKMTHFEKKLCVFAPVCVQNDTKFNGFWLASISASVCACIYENLRKQKIAVQTAAIIFSSWTPTAVCAIHPMNSNYSCIIGLHHNRAIFRPFLIRQPFLHKS